MINEKKKISSKAMNEMEYLMKELYKEWSVSKESGYVKELDYKDAVRIRDKAVKMVKESLDMEIPDQTFVQSVKAAKKGLVLTRLLMKIRRATERIEIAHHGENIDEIEDTIVLGFDEDEIKLFAEINRSRAGNKKSAD